jgi:hypothetical protein
MLNQHLLLIENRNARARQNSPITTKYLNCFSCSPNHITTTGERREMMKREREMLEVVMEEINTHSAYHISISFLSGMVLAKKHWIAFSQLFATAS